MKKLTLITMLAAMAISSAASAQHGAGENGIRSVPLVVHTPAPAVMPAGK